MYTHCTVWYQRRWHLSGLGGVPSNRLWSDKCIDFRGRGQTIHLFIYKSIGSTEAEVFYTTAWYQSYPPHSVFAISSVHWRCPLAVSCQSGGSCPAMSGTWCTSDISTNCPSLTIGQHSGLICLAEVRLQSLCGFFVCLLSLERTDVELFPLGVSANSEQCIWLICVTWVLSSDLVKVFSKSDGDLVGVPNPFLLYKQVRRGIRLMGTLSSSSSHLENTPSHTWSLGHPGHTGVSTIVLLTALTMGQRMAIGQIDTIVCTTNTQTHSASACRTGNRRYIQVSQPLVRSHLCAVNSITNISMIASVFPLPAPITLTLCDWLVTCEWQKVGQVEDRRPQGDMNRDSRFNWS